LIVLRKKRQVIKTQKICFKTIQNDAPNSLKEEVNRLEWPVSKPVKGLAMKISKKGKGKYNSLVKFASKGHFCKSSSAMHYCT
jgi:hypothetical protein